MKQCYIVAGPNGSGKTTFAKTFLPNEGQCLQFINADLIAEGLSPLNPESAALEAGRIMLHKIEEAVAKGESFAFESTLSGKNYVDRIRVWKDKGYKIGIYYLKLSGIDIAVDRVRLRVAEGGHNIAEGTIRRRYQRSWDNFLSIYQPLADFWTVFDNTGESPVILEESQ